MKEFFEGSFTYLLSGFVLLSATGFGVMLFFIEVPEKNQHLVEAFANVYMLAGAVMVLQFFLGSSKGSKDKDKIIKN